MVLTANELVQRAYDRLRVLELGIGTGLTASLYPPDWSVIGIDLSAAMLVQARKRIDELGDRVHVRLLQADGAQLPFEDETFDVVLLQ